MIRLKKLLRNKSNFAVLEGFLPELLKDDIKIHRIGESESNKDKLSDKFNRVDIFVENSKGELIIIEIQNTQDLRCVKTKQKERLSYEEYLKHLRDKVSENHALAYQAKHLIEAAKDEGIEIGVEKGRKEETEAQQIAFILRLHQLGKSIAEIVLLIRLSERYIRQVIV